MGVHEQNMRHQTLQDEKMNKLLFVLTIITSIFTPLTFLVGVYGMNFTYDGQPSIPELLWPHGYLFFWVLALILLTLSSLGGICLFRSAAKTPRRHPGPGDVDRSRDIAL